MAVMISDQEKIPDMFSVSIHPFLEQEGEKKKFSLITNLIFA